MRAWCIVLAAGCGRLSFDGSTPHDDAQATDSSTLVDVPVGGDATPDAALGLCPGFATFCDNFETGDLSTWTGTSFNGMGNTLLVTNVRVRSGNASLESTVPASALNNGAAAARLNFATKSTGTLAVRQWINLASPLQSFKLVLVVSNTSTGQYVTAGGNNSSLWVSSDQDTAAALRDHDSMVPTPPMDTWTCVELDFDFANRRIQLFVDDVEILNAAANDTAPAYNQVLVGVARGHTSGLHLYTDDVVVANQHIGCQ